MQDLSNGYHDSHLADDPTDTNNYACSTCVIGAVLAQVENLSTFDAVACLTEAIRELSGFYDGGAA